MEKYVGQLIFWVHEIMFEMEQLCRLHLDCKIISLVKKMITEIKLNIIKLMMLIILK